MMVEVLTIHGDDADKVEADNGWVVFGDGAVRVRSRCIVAVEHGEQLSDHEHPWPLVRTELAVYQINCKLEDLIEAISQADTHEQFAKQPG